jgi:cyanate permease
MKNLQKNEEEAVKEKTWYEVKQLTKNRDHWQCFVFLGITGLIRMIMACWYNLNCVDHPLFYIKHILE